MLSDEEREALRNFKSEYETCKYNSSDLIIELDDAKILSNLFKTLIAENKELKEDNEYLKNQIPIDKIFYYSYKEFIPKSKVEEEIEELSEEIEIMKVDNMYCRYKEYGGKKKWEEMFQYKYGKHDALQSLLEKEGE